MHRAAVLQLDDNCYQKKWQLFAKFWHATRAAAAPLLRAHVLMHVEHIAYLRVRACVHACYIVRVPSPEPSEAKKNEVEAAEFRC